YNRDGIDRQRARRQEGGFTLGGPIIKNKLFFFGGYQRTDANTAYVPTAQSLVVVPQALALAADRSPEGWRRAFATVRGDRPGTGFANPNCITTSRIPRGVTNNVLQFLCIDPFGPGYKLFNRINPVTGGFVIPSLTTNRYSPLYIDPHNTKFDTNPALSGFDI